MHSLIFMIFICFSLKAPAAEVSFITDDQATIYADFQKRGGHAIVLAHGAIFNKESWGVFGRVLSDKNYSLLAIDFRGYGKSTSGKQSHGFYKDILAAIQFLKAQQGISQITVLGASMGGAAAAKASVYAQPGDIKQLILLSPASIYQPEKLKGAILFIASEDEYLVDALQALYRQAPEPKKLVLIPGNAHAQHIFKTSQAELLTKTITDFLATSDSK